MCRGMNNFSAETRTPQSHEQRKHLRFASVPDGFADHQVLASYLGTFRHPTGKVCRVLEALGYYEIPEAAFDIMRTKKPKRVDPARWPRIQAFVEDAVAVTLPTTDFSAKLVHGVAASYVSWAHFDQHLPLDGEVIWSRELIDLFVNDKYSDLAEGTRRNYRSYLDRISKALVPDEHPHEYRPLNRRNKALAPYTPAEMALHRSWATGQAYPPKRRRAMLMLALCAGAGLGSSEVAHLEREHIIVGPNGILIDVPGNRARQTPLLKDWDEWLLAAIEDVPAGALVWGPVGRRDGSNTLSSFVENAQGTGPRSDRLRNTWLVWHLQNATPLKDLLYAAGTSKSDHLANFLDYCEPLLGDAYLDRLRGTETA